MVKGILYYTDHKLNPKIFKIVQERLKKIGLPIISVSLNKPTGLGKNYVLQGERGNLMMFKQILYGLKRSKADYIFMAEHDVLYHPSHFDFTPPRDDTYYYNNNVYKYRLKDRKIVKYDCRWFSQLCANRKILINHFRKKIKLAEKGLGRKHFGYEPGSGHSKKIDNLGFENFESKLPNIDIRHGKNISGTSRMKIEHFKDKNNCKNFKEYSLDQIPGWDEQFLWNLAL